MYELVRKINGHKEYHCYEYTHCFDDRHKVGDPVINISYNFEAYFWIDINTKTVYDYSYQTKSLARFLRQIKIQRFINSL
jgi:hypothetical protein